MNGITVLHVAPHLAQGGAERVLHLRIGGKRPVTVVQVADYLVVEIDALQRLAGFWLGGVPPLPSAE